MQRRWLVTASYGDLWTAFGLGPKNLCRVKYIQAGKSQGQSRDPQWQKVGLFLHGKCCPSHPSLPRKHPHFSHSEACVHHRLPPRISFLSCFPTHLSFILGSSPCTLWSLERPYPHPTVLQTWRRDTDGTRPLPSPPSVSTQKSLSLPTQLCLMDARHSPWRAFSIDAFWMNKNFCHYSPSYKFLKECHQLSPVLASSGDTQPHYEGQVNQKPGCQIWAALFTQPQRQWSLLPLPALHPGKRDHL